MISLKQFFTLGVLHEQHFHEKRDIIFLNQACFVLLLCSLLIFSFNTILGFQWRSLVPLFAIFFFSIIPFLQIRHRHQLAKIMLISGAMLSGFSSTILFGLEAKTQYYLFASFVLGIVLFSKRTQHIFLFFIHFSAFIFLNIYLSYQAPLISGQNSGLLAYFHLPIIFTSVFVTLSEYVMHYQRYDFRITDLMKSIQEHSELVQIEKTKFEVQTGILQSTNDLLHSEVAQRKAIEQELLASNSELEQFAYVASHDLKEPLRTIGSFTQLLKRRLEHHFDKDSKIYYHYIVSGVKRMSNLLDDLLALSKLNKEYEIEVINLNETLNLNILSLNNTLEKNQGKIINEPLPVLHANKAQMSQLFQNLISNGLKFRREEAPVIEIKCEQKEDHYLFSIKDNGIGIKKEHSDKIFVIFQRLDKKAKFEGTGIGLAICKKIVQNHGGNIWIESTPGQGSTFFFTISKDLALTNPTCIQTTSDRAELAVTSN